MIIGSVLDAGTKKAYGIRLAKMRRNPARHGGLSQGKEQGEYKMKYVMLLLLRVKV